MIRHIVLLKFAPDAPDAEIAAVFAALSALTDRLAGARGFTAGRSSSPEQLERGYLHAFVIDFDSLADLATYAAHPDHRAISARIVALCVGGLDGVLVVDLDI